MNTADFQLQDGEEKIFGKHRFKVITTPGHTSGCVCYFAEDRVFTGDTLFIRGTGRTDFQEGSARTLFENVHKKIFSLPDETLIYPGHDYNGRTVSTVWEEKKYNPRLGEGKTVDDYIEIMENLNLPYPKKMDEAVPANLRLGLS